MITSIAWKNVWRNKVRSLVVICAVTIGVFAGVFSVAVMNSTVVQRIDAAVNEELSHIQINSKNFRNSGDINSILPGSDSIMKIVSAIPGVDNVTGRIVIQGMASTARKSTGIIVYGIDNEKEKKIFALYKKIIPGTGNYFEEKTKLNSVLIGEELAIDLNIIRYNITEGTCGKLVSMEIPENVVNKLDSIKGERFTSEKKFDNALKGVLEKKEIKKYGMKIKEACWSFREGSKIIITFIDKEGNQCGGNFRITGIFRTKNDMFEATSVFVPQDELRLLAGLEPGEYHQIITRLQDNDLTDEVTAKIREDFPGLEVMSWKEIQIDLAMLSDMMQQVYALFMGIILAALAFGIVNTMLMAVLERTRELGMLAAIGMNRRKIFSMIMLESVFLSLVGGIAGMAVGGAVIAATAKSGINLSAYAKGMEAIGYSTHLFPTIDTRFFIITTLLIVLTGILSSIYPARKALKMNPVEAIRGEK